MALRRLVLCPKWGFIQDLPMEKMIKRTLAFLEHDAAGGILLFAAAMTALVLANSPLSHVYDGLIDTPVAVRVGALSIDKSLLHWINDGLMAVFFLLVGLEIKREMLVGELSTPRRAALPAIAALGGMLAPALIYTMVNWHNGPALRGWAIPAATDIAFAVGVMALLGPRVPAALKIFLLALAIIDDLGAIVIIALFYTENLSMTALMLAALGVAGLIILNRSGVTQITPYVLVGVFMWVCVLKSGVHATLAGVVTALAIPLTTAKGEEGPLVELEHGLHTWVTFGILPAFAFANAGVSLSGVTAGALFSSIPVGIGLGLLLGKPLGIVSFAWAAIRLGLGQRPEGASWRQLVGAGVLGGIGFTMSLFIGMLAFPEPAHAAELRLGVLIGSALSAVTGYLILAAASGQQADAGR
jgi:NhaA family Na+:H+ antiporter